MTEYEAGKVLGFERLGRLRAMVADDGHGSWDLSQEDKNAIFAAIELMPNPRLVAALELVLLFHRGGPWTSEDRLHWGNVTKHQFDCTTKGLCDFLRMVLSHTEGATV